jgi:hypothetical protein
MSARTVPVVSALLWGLAGVASAREVTREQALQVAQQFISEQDAGRVVGLAVTSANRTADGSALVVELAPRGYLVVSGDDRLPPIVAFSWSAVFGAPDARLNPLLDLLQADLATRMAHLDLLPEPLRLDRRRQWEHFLGGADRDGERTEYWPEPGSTTTGGWIETQWGQGAPFNMFCPLDLASGQRSLAGCPSVAMAQILAFNRDTRGTRFAAQDRYHHNYGGNNYWIDDDWQTYGFPSFPQLNARLDSLDAHWQAGAAPSDEDEAALVFACGVAATQVYHPQGSGTFGVAQAFAAWQRFGYGQARLLQGHDADIYESLASNMMTGVPAHLAVVTPSWNAGHNLVVDGWNSDGFFHLNFGWNGAYDGWYLVPSELPFNLSVLEGVVVDLFPASTDLPESFPTRPSLELAGWPNPCNPLLNLAFALPSAGLARVDVVNLLGQQVDCVYDGLLGPGSHHLRWQPQVASGVYVVRLELPEAQQAAATRVAVIK